MLEDGLDSPKATAREEGSVLACRGDGEWSNKGLIGSLNPRLPEAYQGESKGGRAD